MTKRRLGAFTITGIAVAGLVAGALLLTRPLWNSAAQARPPAPVSDVNSRTRGCLFQAPAGTPAAQAALQGLTGAARSARNMLVQQFTVPPNVPAGAMLSELAALHCRIVVTVGSQAEVQVAAHARTTKGMRYLVIGTGMPAAPGVTVISAASATPASVEAAVLRIAG